MQSKNITYQNTRILYEVIGKGNPVVLLHGFGEDASVWKYQVDLLKEHFQLLIPQIPGSGGSPIADWQENIGIDEYAECIKAMLDHEQITSCIMIGHSMGGYITLAFAEKYPGLLLSFGLFHSIAFADSEEKKIARAKSIEFIQKNGAYEFIKTSTPNLFSDHYKKDHPEKIDALIEEGKKFTAAALIQYYQAMIARPDRIAVLENFPGPVLFIIGEFDNAIPMESSLKQCYIPKRSHVHILHKSGHMGMWEETTKANEVLFNFLNTAI